MCTLEKDKTDMRYMNGYDIDNAARRYADNPALAGAVQTLSDLKEWTDSNSDGWAYWRPPVQAAAQLMELIDGNGTFKDHEMIARVCTQAHVDRALRPIKAFRTKVTKITADNPVYGNRKPMPWFPITAAERAALRVQAELAAETARADSVRRLADKLAPVLAEAMIVWRESDDAPGDGDAAIVARELAELAVAGW